MNWKALNNVKECIPNKDCDCVIFHRSLGGFMPVKFKNQAWYWLNGEEIPEGFFKYWRRIYYKGGKTIDKQKV